MKLRGTDGEGSLGNIEEENGVVREKCTSRSHANPLCLTYSTT